MDREAPALSILASTQLCAPVATDVSLTFSCACRAPYLDCGLLGVGGGTMSPGQIVRAIELVS